MSELTWEVWRAGIEYMKGMDKVAQEAERQRYIAQSICLAFFELARRAVKP